jgi:hypothetical protein
MPPRLGDLTASSADDEDLRLLANVTGLSERTVRRRCEGAHGNTLLRNLFERDWPREVEDLEHCTAALVRDVGLAPEIAEITGLSERKVSKRLSEAAGKTYVGTLFPELYGEDEEEEEEEDDGDDGERYRDPGARFTQAELVGEVRSSAVRKSPGFIDWLAPLVGLERSTVQRKLSAWHGFGTVRRVFEGEWPMREGAPPREMLGALTSAAVRGSPSLERWIADVAGVSPGEGHQRLEEAHGRSRVDTVLPEILDDSGGAGTGGDEAPLAERLGIDGEWSRPRMIGRILEILGEHVPERLRAERFRGLIGLLARSGIEACDADDPVENVLATNDPSPGIDAKLRLRVRRAPRQPGGGGPQPPVQPSPKPSPKPGPTPPRPGVLGPDAIVGGRYRIVRAIGDQGGFGRVFEVKDESRPDRDLVMKVADGATAEERARNEVRLREEVKIAHRVTHQNACAYLDDALDPVFGVYYATMKHAGVSLQRLLDDGPSFELADAIDIVGQVAEGLDYAHKKKGVIHQDVKPANILVQGEPGNREVRIGDWGISCRGRDTRRVDGTPTVVATVLGMSPGYVAPEQWRGEARSASDQYCLALVFCSLLEGRVFTEHYKFRGLASLATEQNMAVQRALAAEPEDRFASCPQFVTKLREG